VSDLKKQLEALRLDEQDTRHPGGGGWRGRRVAGLAAGRGLASARRSGHRGDTVRATLQQARPSAGSPCSSLGIVVAAGRPWCRRRSRPAGEPDGRGGLAGCARAALLAASKAPTTRPAPGQQARVGGSTRRRPRPTPASPGRRRAGRGPAAIPVAERARRRSASGNVDARTPRRPLAIAETTCPGRGPDRRS